MFVSWLWSMVSTFNFKSEAMVLARKLMELLERSRWIRLLNGDRLEGGGGGGGGGDRPQGAQRLWFNPQFVSAEVECH